MQISQEVRDYAREKGVDEASAVDVGLREKSREFLEGGSKLYDKV
jgi:phosphomethylpyrimidine synthase